METMMTEAITARKYVKDLIPGETIISKDATKGFRVDDCVKLGAGIFKITTNKGDWTVDGSYVVTVETSPELDPFAGLEEINEPVPTAVPLATEKQVDFIAKLRAERGLPMDRDEVARLPRKVASDEIERLLAINPVTTVKLDVPAGRYALDPVGNEGNSVVFYQVDAPTSGKWAGRVFVKRLTGAPGDWRKDRVTSATATNVLKRINEAGAREASLRFGRESKACGVCGSPLSNDESRRLGIGPDCRANLGW